VRGAVAYSMFLLAVRVVPSRSGRVQSQVRRLQCRAWVRGRRSDMQAVVVMSKHATAASLAAGRFVCVARGTGSMASMRGRDAQSLHTSARIRAY
jgi:hypothetical protein